MESNTVVDRIKLIIEYYKESNSAFAERINVDKSNLSKILNGQRTIKEGVINKIVLATTFNKDWILKGEGNPFDEDKTVKEPQTKKIQMPQHAHKENPTPYETYLLPLSAMGGPLTCFAADGVMLSNCEKIVSPIEDVDFAITVYGESMTPKYPSGTRLLIKKINPAVFIEWGKSYVLDTSNGVVVKEVRISDREGCIACYSINPDPKFHPFDVPLSEVYGMYKVLMSLSAE